MSASVLSSPCICWPTLDWRLVTSCLLGASPACFWSWSICFWMSVSWFCSPWMSWEETHPAVAKATARQTASERLCDDNGELMSPHVGTAGDDHVRAAVLRPAALRLLGADRPLFTVGDGAHAGAGHSQGGEIVAHGAGAALAQGEVVLVGAARVGVALDGHRELRLALEKVGVARQLLPGVVGEGALVVVEIDVRAEAAAAQLLVDHLEVGGEQRVLGLVHHRR